MVISDERRVSDEDQSRREDLNPLEERYESSQNRTTTLTPLQTF